MRSSPCWPERLACCAAANLAHMLRDEARPVCHRCVRSSCFQAGTRNKQSTAFACVMNVWCIRASVQVLGQPAWSLRKLESPVEHSEAVSEEEVSASDAVCTEVAP